MSLFWKVVSCHVDLQHQEKQRKTIGLKCGPCSGVISLLQAGFRSDYVHKNVTSDVSLIMLKTSGSRRQRRHRCHTAVKLFGWCKHTVNNVFPALISSSGWEDVFFFFVLYILCLGVCNSSDGVNKVCFVDLVLLSGDHHIFTAPHLDYWERQRSKSRETRHVCVCACSCIGPLFPPPLPALAPFFFPISFIKCSSITPPFSL